MLLVNIYHYNENLQTEEEREIYINPSQIVSIGEDPTDPSYTEVVMSGGLYYYVAMPLEVFLSYYETEMYKRPLQ